MTNKTYLSYTSPVSYRNLKFYQQATIIYDFTVEFCNAYIPVTSRTRDQMTQASRSGKQNIVEGSTEQTSQKSELKLIGVARASLEELLADYEDFLRQSGLRRWNMNGAEARAARALAYGERTDDTNDRNDRSNRIDRSDRIDRNNRTYKSYQAYRSYLRDPETAANAMICLINQTNFLLDRHIKSLEEKFITEGGYTEKLYKARNDERKNKIIGAFWRKYN